MPRISTVREQEVALISFSFYSLTPRTCARYLFVALNHMSRRYQGGSAVKSAPAGSRRERLASGRRQVMYSNDLHHSCIVNKLVRTFSMMMLMRALAPLVFLRMEHNRMCCFVCFSISNARLFFCFPGFGPRHHCQIHTSHTTVCTL